MSRDELKFNEETVNKSIEFWKEFCQGEISVIEIDGNHTSCIKNKYNALKLADVISDINMRAYFNG